jgi:hypothetical protein
MQNGAAVPVWRPSRQRTMMSRFLDVISFLIPFFFWFDIMVVGRIGGSEIIILALLIPSIIKSWKHVIWRGFNKPILIMMGTWLLSQIISDVYNHNVLTNAMKGEALIGFFALDFMVLTAVMYGNEWRILYFAVGAIFGKAIGALILGYADSVWKFDYAPVAIPTVFLLASIFYMRKRYWSALSLIVFISAINIWQNFRSAALITLVAGAAAMPISAFDVSKVWRSPLLRAKRQNNSETSGPFNAQTFLVLFLVLMAGYGISKSYSYLASTGALGDDAQKKYEDQSKGDLGLLVGGRPETLVSWRAVMDAPLLGHGSWAEDPKYSEMLTDLEIEAGYKDDGPAPYEGDSYLIPCHSHLMSAWVFSGVAGAVFWLYIYYLVLRLGLWLITYHPPLAPYYCYLTVTALWDILFSPFGLTRRVEVSFLLVVICTMLEKSKGAESASVANTRRGFVPSRIAFGRP